MSSALAAQGQLADAVAVLETLVETPLGGDGGYAEDDGEAAATASPIEPGGADGDARADGGELALAGSDAAGDNAAADVAEDDSPSDASVVAEVAAADAEPSASGLVAGTVPSASKAGTELAAGPGAIGDVSPPGRLR